MSEDWRSSLNEMENWYKTFDSVETVSVVPTCPEVCFPTSRATPNCY
jgi:hypothetical protein